MILLLECLALMLLLTFLTMLNGLHLSLKVTIELAADNKIPFT